MADGSGALSVVVSGTIREAWVFSGFAEAITRKLPAIPTANQFAVYYSRPDGHYAGWGAAPVGRPGDRHRLDRAAGAQGGRSRVR